jgi:hypothetical protein
MKKLLVMVSLTVACVALFTGCQSTGKVLSSAAVTVDAAMKGWATWVANGYSTPDQEVKVKVAYGRYQASMEVAKTAYVTASVSSNKPVLDKALELLSASETDLINLINLFQKGTTVK